MPPRFVYWTIIAGGLPTAFRATEREELQPTFQRIKEKHPDAEMKYFAQGKLWDSKEEAQRARDESRGAPPTSDRKRDWRPGGEHKDPRQKFIDQKKDRNQRWRAEKHEHRNTKPHGDPLRSEVKPEWKAKPFDRPAGPPRRDWKDRTDWKPRPPGAGSAAPKRFDREGAPRRDWRDKPAQRPDRPAGDGPPKRDWREKPAWVKNQDRHSPGPPKRFDREERPPAAPKRPPYPKRDAEPREPRPDRDPRRASDTSRPPSHPPERGRKPRPFQGHNNKRNR